jgi:hypothetical protein
MPSLKEIIEFNSQYAGDIEVEVDDRFPTVSIGGEDGVFLQGHEAEEFVDGAKKLYEDVGTVTLEDCYRHLAKPYIDAMN